MLSKIAFVFAVIGFCGGIAGVLGLSLGDGELIKIGGVTLHGLISENLGYDARSIAAALDGFLLRTLLYNGALGISHEAIFRILKTTCEKLLAKLPRLPLGTVMDTSAGKLKETIVDQVEGMETTPVAVVFLMMVMGNYAKDYEGLSGRRPK